MTYWDAVVQVLAFVVSPGAVIFVGLLLSFCLIVACFVSEESVATSVALFAAGVVGIVLSFSLLVWASEALPSLSSWGVS